MQFKQLISALMVSALLTFSSVANADMLLQTGIAEVGTTTASLVKKFSVTFATPFSNKPVVVVTPSHDRSSPSGAPDTFAITIFSVTKTGFTANVVRIDGSGTHWGQALFANWIAVSN